MRTPPFRLRRPIAARAGRNGDRRDSPKGDSGVTADPRGAASFGRRRQRGARRRSTCKAEEARPCGAEPGRALGRFFAAPARRARSVACPRLGAAGAFGAPPGHWRRGPAGRLALGGRRGSGTPAPEGYEWRRRRRPLAAADGGRPGPPPAAGPRPPGARQSRAPGLPSVEARNVEKPRPGAAWGPNHPPARAPPRRRFFLVKTRHLPICAHPLAAGSQLGSGLRAKCPAVNLGDFDGSSAKTGNLLSRLPRCPAAFPRPPWPPRAPPWPSRRARTTRTRRPATPRARSRPPRRSARPCCA